MPQRAGGPSPAGAFFDTGFTTIDSLLAVSLLYGLQGKSDCKVAAIAMSRPNLDVAGFVDMVQRTYHGPAGNFAQLPPIGVPEKGEPGTTSPAFVKPFEEKQADGTPVYKNTVRSLVDTADPGTLFRNYLEAFHDGDAFFVLAGPATNLAALLDMPGVKKLIAAKVQRLVIAGGAFPSGAPDPNFRADVPAVRKVLAEWPTPIVAAGQEVGAALPFPGASIDKEFEEAMPGNPVARAYRAYQAMPYDAPSYALSAALYAARPKAGYFKLSDPGKISVDDSGRAVFTASAEGQHNYLIADASQKDAITQAFVELASAKPEVRRFRGPQQLQQRPQQPQQQQTRQRLQVQPQAAPNEPAVAAPEAAAPNQ